MKKFLILPSNSDLNRGDQALIWNTIDLAKQAGYEGDFYMLATDDKLTMQSRARGIKTLEPILKHPGRKSLDKKNTNYGLSLKMKWGGVAILDLIKSSLLLLPYGPTIFRFLLSENEKETLNVMKDANTCFVKGGGFIHSAGKLTDVYTIYYSLFHIALVQRLKKPVLVMPNSFGPFKGIGVKTMVRSILNKCELVTVRESISHKMLEDISVPSKLYPDLGFFLEKKEIDNNVILELKKKYPDLKLVGITARPYRFPGVENPKERYYEYQQSLVDFSKWLYSERFLPVFVEHTLSEKHHEDDGQCIAEIVAQLPQNEYAVLGDKNYDSKDLKSIYSQFDYVVGTRFHSVIFALAEKIPALAITYGGNKGQGIMRDIGLSEYALEMNSLDKMHLITSFQNLVQNRDNVTKRLAEIALNNNIKYKDVLNDVENLKSL